MSKVIPANEPATFTVLFKGIEKNCDTARFQIFSQDGSETLLDDLEGHVHEGEASLTWTAKGPPPEGKERSWRVQYVVTVPGANGQDITKTSEELTVYNNWLDITAINVDDGNPVADAPYEIQIGKGTPVVGNTGQSGTFTQGALPAGEIEEFKWTRWARFEGWLEEKGVVRKAKIKVCKIARIVSPKLERKEGAPRRLKQVVNLPADPAKPHYGPRLKIKVELADGVPGDAVYAKIELDAETKRNDVARGIVDGIQAPWCKAGGKVVELVEGEDPVVELELDVGHAGGSTFTIHVGGNENCADDALVVTNWRRLFYQVTRPRSAPSPSLKRVTAALAEVFVDFIHYDTVKVTAGATKDAPPGSWFPAAPFGGKPKQKYLNVGDGNLDYWRGQWNDKFAPHGVHLICAHTLYDAQAANCEKTFELLDFTQADLDEAYAESGGKQTFKGEKVCGLSFHPGVGYEVLPVSLRDGGKALRSGTWWPKGQEGKGGPITETDVEFKDGGLVVKLPAAAEAILGTEDGALSIRLTVHAAKGPYLGHSRPAEHTLLVALNGRSGVQETDIASLNDAVAHELAHMLRHPGNPPGLSAADHGRQYSANGHVGNHCADGLSDDDYADGAGAGARAADFTDAPECTCVNYGQNSPLKSTSNGKYCPRCRTFLRAEKLDGR